MAGDAFRVDMAHAAEVEASLAALAARFGDMTDLMDIIGMEVEVDIEENFEGEHSPAGVPWPPSNRVRKTAVGKAGPLPGVTGKTLTKTRRLRGSITHKATASSVEVGTNVIYAARHNQGFSGTEQVGSHRRIMRQVFGVKLKTPIEVTVGAHSRQANTPQREFLGISPDGWDGIRGHVADYAELPQ